MKIMTWESLFGPITGKQKPHLSLKNAKWNTLDEDSNFDGIEYAKGSQYKFFETTDFGFVVFSRESKTPSGDIPGKFWHRY